jgi:ectoine hydroxylase-related dioxygenase (phytanoyl-CoA dioxygenase family)
MHSTQSTVDRSLEPGERERFEKDGYLVLRDFFQPEEILAAAEETAALLDRSDLIAIENLRCWFQLHCDTDEWLFDSFEPIIDISPACARLAADARIESLLSSLYGEKAFLFNDKLIFKPPGAMGYKLHQDHRERIIYPISGVNVIICFDTATRENGCIEVFPGYHEDVGTTDDEGVYTFPVDVVDESAAVPLELAPGDLALMHCLTPHRSAPNRTDGWRRHLILGYNAASDGGNCRASYYAENEHGLRRTYAKRGISNAYFL